MAIKDLTAGMSNVKLEAHIADIGPVREFNKFGKSGKVASATLQDDTGKIALSLWNEQIGQFGVGDSVQIQGGYIKEWQGELQLTTGMRGSIEVVKKAEKNAAASKEPSSNSETIPLSEFKKPDMDEEKIEE